VVVIPAQSVEATLDRADARVAAEQRALEAIRSGVTTVEYYHLPTEFDEAQA
jgi:4-hydroxy-4-methyl-2-oxoglutarate aldolase